MASLTLADIDDGIVEALKSRAKANARSLEAEIEDVLTRAVEAHHATVDRWAAVKRIAEMTPKDVPQTDSVLMLREDRER
jgi:plasmid stability protein